MNNLEVWADKNMMELNVKKTKRCGSVIVNIFLLLPP